MQKKMKPKPAGDFIPLSFGDERSIITLLNNVLDNIEQCRESGCGVLDFDKVKVLKERIDDYILNGSFSIEFIDSLSGILNGLVLSKETLNDWIEYVKLFLSKIYSLYQFELFFCFFFNEKQCVVEGYIFSSKQVDSSLEEEIKTHFLNFLRNEYNLSYCGNDEYPQDFKVSFFDISVYIGSREKLSLENLNNYSFFTKKPIFDGLIGVSLSINSSKRKNQSFLEFILALSSVIIGSINSLSKLFNYIEHQAATDPLTGLYNRRMFDDFVMREIENFKRGGSKFCVAYIDIDDFKVINDNYGHPFGDRYLLFLTEGIKKNIRGTDIAARIGGDEFAVIFPHTDIASAERVVKRIFVYFKDNPMRYAGNEVYVKVSAGIAEFPTHGADKETLLQVVDNALYRVKNSGKSTIYRVFDKDEVLRCYEQNIENEALINQAIQNDRIVPYFQPIVNLQDGSIYAYELLLRVHDEKGEIYPAGKFIDIAEKTGKIIDIGRVLIDKALKIWAENSCKELLFINLSPFEIRNNDYIESIFKMIINYGLKGNQICFEVTERDTVYALESMSIFMNLCRDNGVYIAIDDFGEGYSVFGYLKNLNVNFIKIAGDFVKNVYIDDFNKVFIHAVVDIAKVIGAKVVAEFIEDGRIMNEVKKLGVDYGQGYYFKHPLPFNKLKA